MKFTRLRLSGFKSFVDPTELPIETGLTGVVGPNGCGKSNLLEALRWVMGETSYKTMRGSAMDDVIFSGSADRPARNTAEVTVTLDNSTRRAPAQFNAEEVIEVSRRIEREAGSAYRINAREARARDVQMLFADAATGAHSIALVHQGQIGELIAAKPQARRVILEEAAGISGLHHRRHEAELRLRAAEQNLERLDDVIGEIENHLQALRRQARQATRYKRLAAEIRKAEALILHLRWAEACSGVEASTAELGERRAQAGDLTGKAAAAARAEAEASEKIAPLRADEADAAAVLQRLRNEDGILAAEAARAAEQARDLDARIAQIKGDFERERAILADHAAQIEALASEEAEIKSALGDGASPRETAADEASRTRTALDAAEAALGARMSALIELRGAHANASSRISACDARLSRLEADAAALADEIAEEAGRGNPDETAPDDAADPAAVEQALATAEEIERRAEASARDLEARRGDEATTRRAMAEAQRNLDRLEAEAEALAGIANAGSSDGSKVVERITVVPGYETALAAALGDDLEASTMPDAKMRWRELEPLGASGGLPEGADPLGQFVNGPPALDRRLAFIGVVAEADGDLLQRRLLPGQRLVSLEGDLWRWDGFVARAGAETPASRRLAARNRLDAIRMEIDAARERCDEARTAHENASGAVTEAEALDREIRDAWRTANQTLNRARAELAEAEERARAARDARAVLERRRETVAADLAEARQAAGEARSAAEGLDPIDPVEAEIVPLRAEVTRAREALAEAEARAHTLEREAADRERRLVRIAEEARHWHARAESAKAQQTALGQRLRDAQEQRAALNDVPSEMAEKRAKLADAVASAETARKLAADRLAQAESGLAALHQAARRSESELGQAREALARAEARHEAAEERARAADHAIHEELGCQPGEVLAQAGYAAEADLPDEADTEIRLQRLRNERERLGAVNLRADEEATEQEERLTELRGERDDLEKAIRRLRHGIGTLNSEARGRLVAAFEAVNEHFRNLFQTLFGGGTAELAMTESDDPLDAGLEVVARPPGKKPQTLTLLSGGEQALTAIALILAVFRTNPSPICVLDEVDAPLDDANVERFCNLIAQLTRETDTRFLVITHHPYTMARMDRLFGVTMGERGVSKLVSVDLGTAERLREAS